MSPYRKNILVGFTVTGALLILGWMVLKFSSKTAQVFAPPQMPLHFESTRADGIADGSSVFYLGVNVGRVSAVSLKPDGSGVLIEAIVNRLIPIPANVRAIISSSNALGGTAAVNMDTDGRKPAGELQPDSTLKAEFLGLQLNLISPEMTHVALQVGQMSSEIQATVKQLRESNSITDLDAMIRQVKETVAKAGRVMDTLDKTIGDPRMAEELRQSIDCIHSATDSAAKVAAKLDVLADKLSKNSDDLSGTLVSARGHVDDLSKNLGDRLVQISAVLNNVQEITAKINGGKGTAGQLMNDPRLYESLVDSSKELAATVTDLHRLVDQWEQEGISLKLH